MQSIKDIIYTLIKDDATIKTYTGATATDPRVYYAWLPIQIEVNTAMKSYISYYLSSSNITTWDKEESVLTFNIFSINPEENEKINRRIDQILHNQTMSEPDFRFITNVKRFSQYDSYDEDDKVYIKTVTYDVISVPHKTLDAAIADDGGVQTTETNAANNDTTDDCTLLPSSPEVNDFYAIGSAEQFSKVYFDISQNGSGTFTITWEYWDGDSWASLSNVTDNTNGFTTGTGINFVSFTVPSDWSTTSLNGSDNLYFIRGRVSAFTSITTQPLAKQIFL
jgi:hypothetical protein